MSQGLARSVSLFRLFLREQTEPGQFYRSLAEDAVNQVAAYGEPAGKTVVDIGGGPGYFTAEFRARGADCFLFEPDPAELFSGDADGDGDGAVTEGAVLADGYWLPVRDGGADICFSSNVLEHVSDPMGLIGEMVRVTRPGGLIYLSFCNWYTMSAARCTRSTSGRRCGWSGPCPGCRSSTPARVTTPAGAGLWSAFPGCGRC
jgi:SAM-dependent methyltransferase